MKMNEANYPSSLSQSNFLDDDEKIADFEILTKEEEYEEYTFYKINSNGERVELLEKDIINLKENEDE
jgi:hypothetical protein